MPEHTRVGNKIRELRESMGLSVEELAARSESSAKVIEQLEAGELVASLAPLIKIARGLGAHLSTFLDEAAQAGPVVVRAGSAPRVVRFSGMGHATNVGTLDFFALAPDKKDRHMEPFLIDVHPTVSEDCTLSSHEGEEFIYVLSGGIEVTHGKECFKLGAGDSIYYESVVPHQVQASGESEARILAVVYAPV